MKGFLGPSQAIEVILIMVFFDSLPFSAAARAWLPLFKKQGFSFIRTWKLSFDAETLECALTELFKVFRWARSWQQDVRVWVCQRSLWSFQMTRESKQLDEAHLSLVLGKSAQKRLYTFCLRPVEHLSTSDFECELIMLQLCSHPLWQSSLRGIFNLLTDFYFR